MSEIKYRCSKCGSDDSYFDERISYGVVFVNRVCRFCDHEALIDVRLVEKHQPDVEEGVLYEYF